MSSLPPSQLSVTSLLFDPARSVSTYPRFALAVILTLLLGLPDTAGAQARKQRTRVFPAGTIVTAASLRRVCIDSRTRPETLSVQLSLVPWNGIFPHWWPQSSTAMLERIRPDEVRQGGVLFATYRVVRIDFGPTTLRGDLATLVPEAEQAVKAKGPERCLPFDELWFTGGLAKPLRFRQ